MDGPPSRSILASGNPLEHGARALNTWPAGPIRAAHRLCDGRATDPDLAT
jgi:hypothetical protein